MAKKYSAENIRVLEWPEHIRLRPGMYIGRTDTKGFFHIIRECILYSFKEITARSIHIEWRGEGKVNIIMDGIQDHCPNDIFEQRHQYFSTTSGLDFPVLNALSIRSSVKALDKGGETIFEYQYHKGKKEGLDLERRMYPIRTFEIKAELDVNIWGSFDDWNLFALGRLIEQYSFLFKGKTIQFSYPVQGLEASLVYHHAKGLHNALEMHPKGHRSASLYKVYDFGACKMELAMTLGGKLHADSVRKNFINHQISSSRGSHMDGIRQGVRNVIRSYLRAEDIEHEYHINFKHFDFIAVLYVHLEMDNPCFKNATREQIEQPEIVAPIASWVAEEWLRIFNRDESLAEELLAEFKVRQDGDS